MEENNITEKTVKIRIKSLISDLVLADSVSNAGNAQFYYDEDAKQVLPIAKLKQKIDDEIEFTTEGKLTCDGEKITVSYNESSEMGFENSSTSISFKVGEPRSITMVRTGSASTVCMFDISNPRQICTYHTDIFPMEMTMETRSIRNDLTDNGGSIWLDYTVEMSGVKTERNRFHMEVKKSE